MNRLVIVGNGFDRAHGLASGYYDFMFAYLSKCFQEVSKSNEGVIDNQLFLLRRLVGPLNITIKDATFFQEYFVDKRGTHTHAQTQQTKIQPQFSFYLKSDFVRELISNCCDYKWVEIENIFYKHLTVAHSMKANKVEVWQLNMQLEILRDELGDYLRDLKPVKPIEQYRKILAASPIVGLSSTTLDRSLILNFNYTNVGEMYETDKIKSVYIHGNLKDNNNPLIFGFGDELDDMYSTFKRDEECGYAEHLKSFSYPMTDNFHQLNAFMGFASAPNLYFEAVILGHSCGRSDRTLLNYIFEHHNCKSIRAYYYDGAGATDRKSFRKITDNIARQFNVSRYYSKVVSFMQSERMPQHDD